ncbi:glycerophosphodiester phosphodiesterase [Winogradskyella sp. SYSU M77433]|uniref:glycerophosphodiester phosphodiesterase n=1 Tax=Winogradskyella sp. SYSU M77433 TaxID=3042722 RepID=UPI00248083DC|nr:glycerophosphodiester phosphodiesterase [Winogradskyella sp. SYSU M77433]MDH7913159.1 glycerophosphodiester phosphodiesterase [Winogradskyella sp. SYSU M77433]
MTNQRLLLMLKNSFVIILFAILLMSCSSKKQIDIQGHRGCRGLLPENSLPAFEKAIDLGVHTLELDIAITKDNEVVVSHEPFISRYICFNPKGEEIPDSMDMKHNLYKMTHQDIKQFDCGSKFHPDYPNQEKLKTYKPLLAEVFELVKSKSSDVKFNIEIKSKPKYYSIYTPEPETYVKLVLDAIEKHNMFNRVNLQSFDLAILEEVKKQSPKMKVALLVDDNETISTKLNKLSYKPEIISPYFKLLTEKEVVDYQDQNFQIIPWTVNDTVDMQQMIDWQVDGIITDYPDQLIKLLQQ